MMDEPIEHLTWRDVLDVSKVLTAGNSIHDALALANAMRYKYIAWNGSVYEVGRVSLDFGPLRGRVCDVEALDADATVLVDALKKAVMVFDKIPMSENFRRGIIAEMKDAIQKYERR